MTMRVKDFGLRVGRELLGFACCAFQIKGYHLLIPSYYAALLLTKEQRRNKDADKLRQCLDKAMGFGVLIGTICFLPFVTSVRYLMIIAAVAAVIRFYIWANGYCQSLAAGGIVAVVTAIVSGGGVLLMPGRKIRVLYGISEGLISLGLVFLWGYVWNYMDTFSFNRGKKKSEEITYEQVQPKDAQAGTIADAIRGISGILSEKNTGESAAPRAYKMNANSGVIAMDQAWQNRMFLNRNVVVAELNALADMICRSTQKSMDTPDKWLQGRNRRLQYEASESGLVVEAVNIERDQNERLCVEADVASKWKGMIPAEKYKKVLEKTFHCPMRLALDAQENISLNPVHVRAYEETTYYVLAGAACRKKDGATTIGDTYFTMQSDQGRFYGGISDGMGTGNQAKEESELLVEVLQKLLRAGFSAEKSLQMLDAALSIRQEDESYSTLDLVDVDLYSGRANLHKAGAPVSFIKRGQKVQIVATNSLPAGSGVQHAMASTGIELDHGNFLVMLTDGVIEYLHVKSPEDKLVEIIREVQTDNAGAMAYGILDRVMPMMGDKALDDMTVLVMGLWER